MPELFDLVMRDFDGIKDAYYREIAGMAGDVAKEIEDGDIKDQWELDAAVTQAAERSQFSTFVPYAVACLWVSSNGDTYFESNGSDSEFDPCAWAAYAVEADISDELISMGYDLGSPAPLAEEETDEEEADRDGIEHEFAGDDEGDEEDK